MIYITEKSAPEVVVLGRRAFPSYTGKQFKFQPFKGPKSLASYWSGGSRDSFVFVAINPTVTGKIHIGDNGGHPAQPDAQSIEKLALGVALVEHTIFCGKDMGLTIYLNPEDINQKMLPVGEVILSPPERLCLVITCHRKAAYRREEASRHGLGEKRWDAAVKKLIARGLLAKNGAITAEGRNVCGDTDLYNLPVLSSFSVTTVLCLITGKQLIIDAEVRINNLCKAILGLDDCILDEYQKDFCKERLLRWYPELGDVRLDIADVALAITEYGLQNQYGVWRAS